MMTSLVPRISFSIRFQKAFCLLPFPAVPLYSAPLVRPPLESGRALWFYSQEP